MPLLFLLTGVFIAQANNPTSCVAATCPQPAATGRQPFPSELVDIFNRAGTNRLGTNGPTLPQINTGYPQFQAIAPYVPCILLKTIGAVETAQTSGSAEFDGWKQFNANYGQSGTTVIAADCGYGIMQITSGMAGGAGFDPARVASEPAYNVGTAARALIEKWNSVSQAIGDNDPYIVEDWYYAVWAYNSFSSVNDPNDISRFPAGRTEWKCNRDSSQNAAQWPYQEKVWGCSNNPPEYPAGNPLWAHMPLSLPVRQDVAFPPPPHIATPLPAHRSCSTVFVSPILNSFCLANLIQNPSFEGSYASWFWGGRAIPYNSVGYSGTYTAMLGDSNSADDAVYQPITIPTVAPTGGAITSVRLDFQTYIYTEETIHPADILYIKVRDSSGTDLATLGTLSDQDVKYGWIDSNFDLSPYIGQTIQIYFEVKTDSARKTYFFLDEVTVSACT
jgi:hypothetical protein